MTKGVYMPKRTGGNGEHVVTMREVAKAAGVSIKTVSNVVNDYEFVSQATRDKVNKAIVELGYTVNVSARNLRRGQTGIIGLAIPDLQMPYFAQLSSLVIEEAKKVGLRVIVEPTQYSRDGELEALHGSQQTMIDGLIYSPLELGQDDVEPVAAAWPWSAFIRGRKSVPPHCATKGILRRWRRPASNSTIGWSSNRACGIVAMV